MPELIDKAKLLEYLAAIKPDEYVSAYGEAAVDVINHVETYVSEMPTIEAEPVRRGRWIEVKKHRDENGTILTDYECSECFARVKDCYPEEIESERFCYNCGADMREEGDDNA